MSSILIPEHYDDKLSVIVSPNELKRGGLFLGNEKGARDPEMLNKKRITAVLTISSEIGKQFVNARDLIPNERTHAHQNQRQPVRQHLQSLRQML